MAIWNPAQYMKYGAQRLRPALDLIGQISLDSPRSIVDLGCGPGNVTAILKERWPNAQIMGMDSSKDMLEKAQKHDETIKWQHVDVQKWIPDHPIDLIFSNACLHWLDDHNDLFIRLMSFLSEGGVLAVQMPNNFEQPTHQSIRDVLGESHILSPGYPVHSPQEYYDWLKPHCSDLNIWETTYMHVLDGDNPVADWTKGAALRPILDGLGSDQERDDFETAYRAVIKKNYPKSSDGKTVMSFKRLFMIAKKNG